MICIPKPCIYIYIYVCTSVSDQSDRVPEGGTWKISLRYNSANFYKHHQMGAILHASLYDIIYNYEMVVPDLKHNL